MLGDCGWSFYIFGPKNNKFYANFSAGENELHKIFPTNSFLAKEKSHHLMSGTKSNFLAARKKFKEEKAKKRKRNK